MARAAATSSYTQATAAPDSTVQPYTIPDYNPFTPGGRLKTINTGGTRVDDSPVGKAPLQASTAANLDVANQRAAMTSELERHVIKASPLFATELYETILSKEKIKVYLAGSQRWDGKKWLLPGGITQERSLYRIFASIITETMKAFGIMSDHGRFCWIEPKMYHTEDDDCNQASSPDLVIMGASPFVLQVVTASQVLVSKATYQTAIACIDVKLDKYMLNTDDHLPQLAVYARQMFSAQPNRLFVRCLTLSEKAVRVYHFDRSGAKVSAPVNIHKDPYTFVRLIVGLTSKEPSHVGFDPRFTWATPLDPLTNKVDSIHGRVEVGHAQASNRVVCKLVNGKPLFSKCAIRSRATTCWKIIDAAKEEWILKEAFRAAARPAEWEFLKEARNLKGVAQIVAWEDVAETANYRGTGASEDESEYNDEEGKPQVMKFVNKVKSCVVMKCYGDPIHQFKNPYQVLYALHDAIEGHRNLWLKGILHRDISSSNILIGFEDLEGWRGVLIDLDMAIWLAKERERGGVRTGTRLFQSTNILSSYQPILYDFAPHDHLDDLESFYYVLVILLFTFGPYGQKREYLLFDFRMWDHQDPMASRGAKDSHMADRFPQPIHRTIKDSWGQIFAQLVTDFHEVTRDLRREKASIKGEKPDQETHEAYQRRTLDHYESVLNVFRKAIKDIKDSPPPPPPSSAASASAPSTSPAQSAGPSTPTTHVAAASEAPSRHSLTPSESSDSLPQLPNTPPRSTRGLRELFLLHEAASRSDLSLPRDFPSSPLRHGEKRGGEDLDRLERNQPKRLRTRTQSLPAGGVPPTSRGVGGRQQRRKK